jgi:hypothetical protein
MVLLVLSTFSLFFLSWNLQQHINEMILMNDQNSQFNTIKQRFRLTAESLGVEDRQMKGAK